MNEELEIIDFDYDQENTEYSYPIRSDSFENSEISPLSRKERSLTMQTNQIDESENPDEKGFEKRKPLERNFAFKKMDLPGLTKTDEIKRCYTSAECRILVTKSNKFYRWRINQEQEFKSIDLIESFGSNFIAKKMIKDSGKYRININKVFIDRKGFHTIICLENGYSLYLNFREGKARVITSLKNINIKVLSFTPFSMTKNAEEIAHNERKTGEIVFSSGNGMLSILSLELIQNDLVESINQNVFEIPSQTFLHQKPIAIPLSNEITHIEVLKIHQSNVNGRFTGIIILITTASSIYSLIGQTDDIMGTIKKYNGNEKVKEYSELLSELGEKLGKMAVENKKSNPPLSNSNLNLLVKQEESKCPIVPFQVFYHKKTGRPLSVIWLTYKKCLIFKVPGEKDKNLESILNKRDYLQISKKIENENLQVWPIINSNQNFNSNTTISQQAKNLEVKEYPIKIGITEYSYVLLYQDCISIMSLITKKVVYFEDLPNPGIHSMIFEESTCSFWVYEHKNTYRLNVGREGLEAWKFLVDEKRYREAYKIVKEEGGNLEYVASLYADDMFSKKQYISAAKVYSDTDRNFEEIFLKFLSVSSIDIAVDGNESFVDNLNGGPNDGLITFIKIELDKINPELITQRNLLISFLIENYIHTLDQLEKIKSKSVMESSEVQSKSRQIKEDLENLINRNIEILNPKLIYLVMMSHGRVSNLMNFAKKKNDIEMIIERLLSEDKYEEALDHFKIALINENSLEEKKEEKSDKKEDKKRKKHRKEEEEEFLEENSTRSKISSAIYQNSVLFFKHQPKLTAEFLINHLIKFKIAPLLPGIISIPLDKRICAIELLTFSILVLKARAKSIHNILLFFYVESNITQIAELLSLLKDEKVRPDLDFGLRMFRKYEIKVGEIIIFGLMKDYPRAVNLALDNDREDLAIEYANKVENKHVKKELWMLIAKNSLQSTSKTNIITIIKTSNCLQIEDILPFFNSTTLRSEILKEELCESLRSHVNTVDRLNGGLNTFLVNAEQLKNETKFIKNRCIQLDNSNKCEECFKTLFNTAFYLFPCLHGFHKECLFEAVKMQPNFEKNKVEIIKALEKRIVSLKERIQEKKNPNQDKVEPVPSSSFSPFSSFSFLPEALRPSSIVTSALNIFSSSRRSENDQNCEKEEAEIKSCREKIGSLIAMECIYCGPGIVDTIMKPFEDESLKESWSL